MVAPRRAPTLATNWLSSEKMLVACDTRCFDPHPLEAALDEIRAAGLVHVEIPLATLASSDWPDRVATDPGADVPGSPGVGRRAPFHAQRLLTERGLRAAAVDVGSILEIGDKAERARRLDGVLALGAEVVVADGGGNGSPTAQLEGGRLPRFLDAAAERGLTVAFDMLPGWRLDAREMLRVVSEVGHPALRLCFDTGAYVAHHSGGSGEVALQRVCTQLGAVRLRDATGVAGEEDYPPLGQGAAVDFTRTREILQAVAFRGPCTISFTLRRRSRPPTLEECRAGLARSVRQLTRGGWLDVGAAP